MTHRIAVACLASFVLVSCGEEAERPNVLLITVDTLRADRLGTYGYERNTSPEIDAFAETAVLFEDAYSSASWTLPGLASLMTAHYPSAHGVTDPLARLHGSHDTLAEELRDAGYDTAMVACHLFQAERFGLQQGFVHVDDDLVRSSRDSTRTITSPPVSDRGIEFMEHKAASDDERPWFLWLHYFDPHGVYLPHEGISEEFGTEEESDLYDGEIRFTDLHVGRVLTRLGELGLDSNTIVVFTADHGEEFGDHGGVRHGKNLYRETVQVPLILRVPGIAPRRVAETASVVNVKSTLLDLLSIGPRKTLHGESLAGHLNGESTAELPAVSEVSYYDGQDMRNLRKGRWTYYEYRMGDKSMDLLFDRSSDPTEHRNLAKQQPDIAVQLRAELQEQIDVSRIFGRRYGSGATDQITASDLERLGDLGYVER